MSQRYTYHADLPPVSRIAYGCMGLGGEWGAETCPDSVKWENFAAIEAALEAGINFFDHADIYKAGKSEEVFGEFLAANPDVRGHVVIQTKCGIRDGYYDFDPDYIVSSVEGSLRRLRLEQVDCLLLHRPDLLIEPERVAEAFDRLHRSGKVKAFGVSNFTSWQIELLQAAVNQKLCANQINLSLHHHALLSDPALFNTSQVVRGEPVVDYCRLHNVRIQAYSCMGRGRLLAKREDWTEAERQTQVYLEELAEKYGVGMDAILIAWLLRHPAGIQPILGTSKADRIASACRADAISLERSEWYALLQRIRGKRVP